MKFKVTAELRRNIVIGEFEAKSEEEALRIAEETHLYKTTSNSVEWAGIYETHVERPAS